MRVLHIFKSVSAIYTTNTVNMIMSNNCFKNQTHTFVVPSKKGLESIEGNLLEEKTLFCEKSLKLLKNLSIDYNIVVIHALTFSKVQMINYPNWLARRTVWCVWGHDFCYKKDFMVRSGLKDNLYKLINNTLINLIEAPKVRKFKAVAVGFLPDGEKIKKIYGNTTNIIQMPYDCGYKIEDIPFIQYEDKEQIKVMIGHSAFAHLNHIKVIDKIKKLNCERITISIPLAYGESAYKNDVYKAAERNLANDCLEIIDSMISLDEYVKYLKTVDVAIFDTEIQTGLANIYLLLAMGKKVYLNGDMLAGFKSIGASVFNAKDIDDISTASFTDCSAITLKNRECVLPMLDSKAVLNMWDKNFSKWETQTK